MGDRNNPMKFGPEWLRNLSRERSGGGNGSNNSQQPTNSNPTGYGSGSVMGQNTRSLSGPNPGVMSGTNSGNMVTSGFLGAVGPQALASSTGAAAMGGDLAVPGPSTGAIPRNRIYMNKVQLAKLRYGREEMLALYDKTVESPEELKYFDLLYQPRGKAPFALLNSFEEDTRGNGRGAGTLAGHVSNTERYTSSRGGIGRGMALTEAHGRSRMPFVRQPSLGRGNAWHVNNTRHTLATTQWPQHSSVEDESTLRSWNNNNNVANPGNRTTSETPEWNPNKTFRRRPNNNTNWRQPQSREEGDEWRSNENNKNRPPSDKWDREWGERPNQDRQQSWNSNRKTWVGNENMNDDNLPEWAVDSVEAGAGTFDSSGAFHGYSNDDSNIPKSQETCLPLARSQTHGSFSHLKSAEEGSDEWWTSEKRKKLSAKNFDAATGKYSQVDSFGSAETLNLNSKNNVKIKDNNDPPETQDNANDSNGEESNQNMFTNQFQESKTFDALMRSEMTLEESNDERSNFQSVMIPPNNGLRQKHQNLVPGAMDSTSRHSGLLQMIRALSRNQSPSDEFRKSPDEMIVEKILDMSLDESKMQNQIIAPMLSTNCMNPGMPNQMANPNLQIPMGNQGHPNHSLVMNSAPNMQMGHFLAPMQPMPNVGLPNQINSTMQNVGMHNVAMNSALPLGPVNNGGLVMAMRGVPQPVMPNPGMQTRLGFQPNTGMPMMPRGNASGSLFMDPSNPQIPNQQQSNAQNNMFPMQHQMKHSAQVQASQSHFNSMYNVPPPITPDSNLVDAWYYEDPEKMIQGPFSSKEMYNWYRAGFFSPSLMVRRACETHLRPLGSYGPVVPFIQLDSLWSPPVPSADMIWMQQMNSRNESRINNLPMFFWDAQGNSAISSNSALPEEIVSEMKTEDQILAQLRASQNLPIKPNVTHIKEQPPTSSAVASVAPSKPDDSFPTTVSATPNLDVLNKLIDTEKFGGTYNYRLPNSEIDKNEESEVKDDKPTEVEMPPPEPVPVPSPVPAAAPALFSKPQETPALAADSKTSKQTNNETDKTVKKDVATKGKNKKAKEEKKEEISETKTKKEEIPTKTEQKQTQKRSVESSPTKNKKEDKPNKKEQDKEKKELIKDGFTIVKGVDKTSQKESKKKVEEGKLLAAAAEESERKRKDEEKMALEEEKKRKIDDAIKKAQEQQQQRQECVPKKAPWSSVSTQVVPTTPDGLTLQEIQRLEREKKVEQMREQQHMIHLIAQQQAAALAREQEMQAGLGWAKKSSSNLNTSRQSLAEIQTETRKAAAAAASSPVTALVEEPSAPAIPWTSTPNGGFWETQASVPVKAEKTAETLKPSESGKSKKKLTLNTSKKETTPKVEFESWCTTILTSWSSKIDVPTFIGFLKDIESPYEVKDYVKCYLGDSKDSSDFARQFLERRSKLLRVGMVTPSDDLCSPAMAINPRNTNLGEYQEVKGKGKKTKKNKMLKVDARILGFSVTASEDRINVGDIDTV